MIPNLWLRCRHQKSIPPAEWYCSPKWSVNFRCLAMDAEVAKSTYLRWGWRIRQKLLIVIDYSVGLYYPPHAIEIRVICLRMCVWKLCQLPRAPPTEWNRFTKFSDETGLCTLAKLTSGKPFRRVKFSERWRGLRETCQKQELHGVNEEQDKREAERVVATCCGLHRHWI